MIEETYCAIAQPLNLTQQISSQTETISEGKARLAYRPRDDKFLNLEKGDVVLVKSKNAGKKSHLWGGQVRYLIMWQNFVRTMTIFIIEPCSKSVSRHLDLHV